MSSASTVHGSLSDWNKLTQQVDMKSFRYGALPPPTDSLFMEQLPKPLQEMALAATDPLSEPSQCVDQLEIQMRRQAFAYLAQLNKALPGQQRDAALQLLGDFWSQGTILCWHMIFMSQTQQDERFQGLGEMALLRKLPLLILEDILETCILEVAVPFFQTYGPPMFPILFGPLLWTGTAAPRGKTPPPPPRQCWLPFLKLANQFLKRLSLQAPQNDAAYKDAMATLMLILCQVYPLADKSATRMWGAFNDQAITLIEEEDEFAAEQAQLMGLTSPEERGGAPVPDFTLYESFWTLQQDFNRPNAINLSDFLQRLRSLITTLEHTKVKKMPTSVPAKLETANDDAMDVDETTTAKDSEPPSVLQACANRYLTSSRLLTIQLQDGEFRIPILTQVLIVCHHLIQISPVVLKAKLTEWQTRAQALLQAVAPDHLQLFQSVLGNSEESWRTWKRNKCTPDLDKRQSESLVGRKRKRSLGGALSSTGLGDDDSEKPAVKQTIDALKSSCCQMRQSAPTLQQHLEEYVDALDPESGIEAEYHPKNNAHFCWRAMRLLSAHHLAEIGQVSKRGDFEGMVRNVYATNYETEIPGDMPDFMKEKDEDDEIEEVVVPKKATEESKPEDEDENDPPEEESTKMEEDAPMEVEKVEPGDATTDKREEPPSSTTEMEIDSKPEMDSELKAQNPPKDEIGPELEDSPKDSVESRSPSLPKQEPIEELKPEATTNGEGEKEEHDAVDSEIKEKSQSRSTSPARHPAGHSSSKPVEPVAKTGFAAMDKKWIPPPQPVGTSDRNGGHVDNASEHPRKGGGDHASSGGAPHRSSHDNTTSRGRGGDYNRGGRRGGSGTGGRDDRYDRNSRDEPRSNRGGSGGGDSRADDRFDSRGGGESRPRGGGGGDGDRSRQNDDRGRGRQSDDRRGGGEDRGRPASNSRGGDDRYDTSSNKPDEASGRGGGGSGRYSDDRRRGGGGGGGGDRGWRGGDRDRSRGAGPRHRGGRR
uniref:Uncharacterized protein n=1 Tax=Entomoneis paludosa TaxID=265537 RepID=A0A7S2VH75_9STRA